MSPENTVSLERDSQPRDLAADRLIDALVRAIQGKLKAKKGTVTEAQKLTIEAYRRNGDTFEIQLKSTTR